MWRVVIPVWFLGCQSEYEVVVAPVSVHPGEVAPCDFTQVGDTDFWAYDCNPVFTTTGEDWAPTVGATAFAVTEVMGHPFYQLWYTGVPNDADRGEYGLGYAVSSEGTDWSVHAANPMLTEPAAPNAWDASNMDQMQVVWDPETSQYVMVYQGYNIEGGDWGLGVAVSDDGSTWSRSEANPVFDLGDGIGAISGWCWPLGLTLSDEGSGYTGYIAGAQTAITTEDVRCEVYRLKAPDADHWVPDTSRVLAAGPSGSWDDQGIGSLAIATLGDTQYMFYQGFGSWIEADSYVMSNEHFFGMAIMENGGWTKQEGPIPLNTTEEGAVGNVAAHTVGDRVHLWISDDYDGVQSVGYFLYDPNADAETEAETE